MAIWKKLHRSGEDAKEIFVNMDAVIKMQRFEKHTTLYFAVAEGEHVHSAGIKELPDEILAMPAIKDK